MAFHIDCKGRHGLISIENKPASYGQTPWECNTCKRTIRGHHIGVLNCERCRCDICPDCWTALLPKIVNASGYPCFWREVQPPHARSTTRLLGCHRRNVCTNGSPAQYHQLCGIESPTAQCNMCANKQRELEAAQGGQFHTAISFSQSLPVHFFMRPEATRVKDPNDRFNVPTGSPAPFPAPSGVFAAPAAGSPFGGAPANIFGPTFGPCFGSKSN